jgi:hypothetical protein
VEEDWLTSIRSSRHVQGWAWKEEEVTGGGVPMADQSGSGEELVGERFPSEEGGEVLVQQLQQEERKLLGGLDRSEEGRRDEFDGNRNSLARRWRRRGGSGGGPAARSGLEVSVG